jgi:DNA modification methylase
MYDNKVAYKIAQQYKQAPFTDFASVNPDTDLNSLNLNWREKDLPERVRTKHVHRLHPYMGKFIPQLVEIFLRKFRPRLVYDPFCGSGTTMVEANALGIDSIGTDISVFNVLLSKVKTDKYDIELLDREIHEILRRLSKYKREFSNDEKVNRLFTTKNKYLNEWYADQARKELLCYLRLIQDYTYQDLLKIILSRSARSARLVTHYDLDFPKKPQREPYYCHKHGRICTPVQEAHKFLSRYTVDTFRRIKEFDHIRTDASVKVIHGDSREVDLPKGIDMVFTSPPYIGLIDYHDQHKYAYELLGLENNEEKEIGSAKKGTSDEAKKEYIEGINQVLLHTRDFMTKKGIMVIVVNDKYNLYDPSKVGFKAIGRVERHVNRRTGRRNGAFYESILIWQKI